MFGFRAIFLPCWFTSLRPVYCVGLASGRLRGRTLAEIDRRELLLCAASAGLLASGRATAVAPIVTTDFGQAAANLGALLKILGSTNPDEVAVTYGTGRVFACLNGEQPVPLFSTHSVSAARSRLRPDGSFLLRQHIIGFRTAFESESIIDRMSNPLTGESVDLPLTDYGIGDVDYRLGGTYALRAGVEPTRLNRPSIRPWTIDAGTLAISDDAVLAGVGPAQPKIDAVTRFARVEEILDEKVASARSWFSFSAVDPFRPWLKMRQLGFQLWHVHGRKVDASAPLPAFIAHLVRRRFPKLFELAAP